MRRTEGLRRQHLLTSVGSALVPVGSKAQAPVSWPDRLVYLTPASKLAAKYTAELANSGVHSWLASAGSNAQSGSRAGVRHVGEGISHWRAAGRQFGGSPT